MIYMKGIRSIMKPVIPEEVKRSHSTLLTSCCVNHPGMILLVLLSLIALQTIFCPISWGKAQSKQDTKGGYYLGFSSYQDQNMALSEVARLKEQGYRAFFQTKGQGTESKYVVLVGPYSTKEKATAEGQKLKKAGLIDKIKVIAAGNVTSTKESSDSEQKASVPNIKKENVQTTGKEKIVKTSGASLTTTDKTATQTEKSLTFKDQSKKSAKMLPTSASVPPATATKMAETERKAPSSPSTSKNKTNVVPSSMLAKTEKKKTSASLPAKTPLPPVSTSVKEMGKPGQKTAAKEIKDSTAQPAPLPEIKLPPPVVEPLTPAAPAMPPPPVTPAWPYFDGAMQDFQKGRYAKARPIFQDTLTRREIASLWRELAERRLADCNYFLKESNSNEILSEIVYQYKNILFKYPDIRSGNDLAYWRLGQLYKGMALYVDAVDAYKNLLGKYPASPLAEEGLYQMGEILRLDKKYPEAIEALQTFYAKYPGSALSRPAIFALADTYYRMGRSQEADAWYNNALQRWPDLYGLPDGIFLNTGYHFYNTGNYRRAFQVFSYYYSLYPKSRYAASAARAMARSLAGMGQVPSAVRLLSMVLDKEKDKKEAIRTRLLLAELGSGHPGARTSVCFRGVENYREPLLSCAQMMAELKGDALTEEVLYRKGNILKTMNNPREAFDTHATLLRLYPKSAYRASCQQDMEEARNTLVNDYYTKRDYLAVADLYFTESGFKYHRDWDVLFKVADSLKQLGLYQEAAKTFQDLKNTQEYQDPDSLDLAIAETEMNSGRIRNAQSRLVILLGQKRAGAATLKKAHRILADSYYREMKYDAAIESYAAGMPVDRTEKDAALTLYRYADALKRRGLGTLALQYYQDALNAASQNTETLPASLKGELFMNLGECYFAAGQYDKGITLFTQSLSSLPKGSDQRWALFRLTGGYIKTNNPDLAEQSSGRVKENTEDPFWGKMADYGLNDGIWFATYDDFLK